jgi:hypothetical protein
MLEHREALSHLPPKLKEVVIDERSALRILFWFPFRTSTQLTLSPCPSLKHLLAQIVV